MTRVRIILIGAFLLVFTAGITAGLAVSHRRPHRGRAFLAKELNLTAQQQDQMRDIWRNATRASRMNRIDRRRELRGFRDESILDMLSPDQLLKFDEIQQAYELGLAELDQQREQAIEHAVEQTKAILAPEQAALYEQLRPTGPTPDRRSPFRGKRRRPRSEPTEPVQH